MQRESQTFVLLEDANKWMEEKTAENELALFHPEVYNAPLAKMDLEPSAKPTFYDERKALILFRTAPDQLDDRTFMNVYNAVPDYERTHSQLLKYKRLLEKLRG